MSTKNIFTVLFGCFSLALTSVQSKAVTNVYTIQAYTDGHGVVYPEYIQVPQCSFLQLAAVPTNNGYGVERWVLDSQIIVQRGGSGYLLSNITANHRLDVYFSKFSDVDDLGGGVDSDQVSAIVLGVNGEVYAGGSFYMAGSSVVYRVAMWYNSSWTNLGAGDRLGTAVAISGLLIDACRSASQPRPDGDEAMQAVLRFIERRK